MSGSALALAPSCRALIPRVCTIKGGVLAHPFPLHVRIRIPAAHVDKGRSQMTTGDVHEHRESPAMTRPRDRGSRVRAVFYRPGNSMGRARRIGPAVVAASVTVLVACGTSTGSPSAATRGGATTASAATLGASHRSAATQAAAIVAIARDGMKADHLKAVIVRVTVDGKPVV